MPAPSSAVSSAAFAPPPPAARPGQPLAAVDTPALLLDLDAFERNLDRMQAAAEASGVRLRPHAKAHKCPDVARAQLARGAVGICCQKASEALPFLQAGIGDILVSNQLASPAKAAWLAQWARHARIAVCVDDAAQVDALSAAADAAGSTLGVLVEIDIGQGRCGVADADAALRLIERIAPHAGLDFLGLQAYHGGLQHLRGCAQRRAQALAAAERAGRVVAALERAGVRCATVTGGGTGSVEFDLESGVYTEVQPGSYAFMDRDYADNERGEALRFEHALFVATAVMSTAAGTHAVVDAGLKSLALDSGLPAVWPPGGALRYLQANDEHGLVGAEGGAPLPPLGSVLRLVPGHCDPTFNLHDEIVGWRGDTVECVWPVAARGLAR
ncbi:DSD1 family PLP-dependent enzyme [Caldimonas tepidiphila]|uniref:DSD1 family PLP-dependent enzyme n=1 Tax=Caldimonas tepidiphila TaxID=2315841 RepID=UPI000E5BB31B|nr:DSD1 family PLP-dependent enzyme [Caldimonas tepidiphila]